MSYEHQEAVRLLRLPSSPLQFVINQCAYHACKGCGISWAGVPLLAAETRLSEATVRAALAELRRLGHLRVVGYPSGGRGRATEYVVAEKLVELSTDKCEKCGKSNKIVDNFRANTNTLQPVEGISTIPSSSHHENPPAPGPQPSVELEPSSRARAREAEPADAGNSTPDPTPPPTHLGIAARRAKAKQMVSDLATHLALDFKPKTKS